jgi:hypothetical protein
MFIYRENNKMNVIHEERRKEIEQARQEMKNATPEAYPQARVRYFTLKEGQGWLRTEKERLAAAETDPLLKSLDSTYEQSKQTPAATKTSDSESRYLHRRLLEEKDKVGVALRNVELGSVAVTQTSMLPYILDILIAVSGLGCVYLLASGKASRIMGFFRPTNTI